MRGILKNERQALATLEDGQSKLVVDLISLMTLHGLGAADTVIKAFGTLSIAQSTIDELESIIREREILSKREGMSVGKEGDQYVRTDINPEDVRRDIEYLKTIIKWIDENCEVDPCIVALEPVLKIGCTVIWGTFSSNFQGIYPKMIALKDGFGILKQVLRDEPITQTEI